MNALLTRLHNDEAGFLVSAELVLVATIAVLGLVVGLSELAWNVNEELEDVGSAFNHLDQSYHAWGTKGHSANARSSCFVDHLDYCGNQDDLTCGY